MMCLLTSGNSQKWINLLVSSQNGIRPFATKSHVKARTKKNVEILIKSDKVVLFSKTNCCRSEAAKRLFDEIKMKYTAIDIDRREDGHFIQSHLGITTGCYYMPRIFIMGKCIGGLCELREMHEDGRLLKFLKQM